MMRPLSIASCDLASIDARIFAGILVYAALVCTIGNEISADFIRFLHQIPTKEAVFFFATSSPVGSPHIPQTGFAPAAIVLAILADANDDSPSRRIRYRFSAMLAAKRFCTIALLSFGITLLYLATEAFQLFEMPLRPASPALLDSIFGDSAHLHDTGAVVLSSGVDAFVQMAIVLAVFALAKALSRSNVAAFAIAGIASALMSVRIQTSLTLGIFSFLKEGAFPIGLPVALVGVFLAFIACNFIEPSTSDRSNIMSRIEIDDVSKRIKKHTILKHISLELEAGRCYELKGPNGSGKTMLLKIIAGLVKPTEGSVRIDGKTLGKDIEFPRETGVLIEAPAFIGERTGLGNLKLLASIRNTASEEDLRAVLKTVELDPDLKTPYRKYSLGMKQRLGIAAAIMEDPRIVLLDEPLNALDEKGVAMVKRVIGQYKENGALVVISNHSNDLLDEVIDATIVFANGTAAVRDGESARP